MSKRTTAERNAIKRAKLAEAAAQAAVNPFDAAYGDRPITPEAAYWDERGFMHWQLPTNERGSRLAFSRNFANPPTSKSTQPPADQADHTRQPRELP